MPRPASERSRRWSQGYERGSVMDRASMAEKKRLKDLLKRDAQDGKALERSARFAGWTV